MHRQICQCDALGLASWIGAESDPGHATLPVSGRCPQGGAPSAGDALPLATLRSWPARDPGDLRIDEVQSCLQAMRLGLVPNERLRESWDEFFRACEPAIRRLVSMDETDAHEREDRIQDVWYHLLANLERYRPLGGSAGFRRWLSVLVRRVLADHRRRRPHRHSKAFEEGMDPVATDPRDAYDRGERIDEARHILDRLRDRVPPLSFRALHLVWIEGRTKAEVASILGISREQVRWRCHRAIKECRRMVDHRPVQMPPRVLGRTSS